MIPNTIHRIWLGGPMPNHLERYGQTWVEHHPDWSHVLWTEDNLPPLRNQRLFDQAETIAPNNVGQLRSDIVRYEILYTFGGVYTDCDLECLRPIDGLLRGVDCFAGWERQAQWVGNTILGSVPDHPFFADLIVGLPANVRRRAGSRPNKLSGPQYLTRVYRRHAKSVTVFNENIFYPYGWDELDRQGEEFPGSYTAHHWQNQRDLRGATA